MNGKLVIFSAPSGAGKSTIINKLLAKGLKFSFSISATSRAPRGTEKMALSIGFFLKSNSKIKLIIMSLLNTKRFILVASMVH